MINDPPSNPIRNFYNSLPEKAREYFVERTDRPLDDLCYKLSTSQITWMRFNLLRIYPLFRMKYLNANELCCLIVNGEHRVCRGPGFYWTVGVTDALVLKTVIGNNINFGPIHIIYVEPAMLKFAKNRNTGRPMLLGPGMHFFNDINMEMGDDISMNFKGDNQAVRCDQDGMFQFVFVKTGSEAIIILRDGQLSTLGPGLHFIEAPDALKTFVSIQQEHFKFGTCDANQCFLTADNIELHINATIFYRISDVRTMFTTRIKDYKDLIDTLHSQAMATLLTIIRSENFQGIGQRDQSKTMSKDFRTGFNLEMQGVEDVPIVNATIIPQASAPATKVLESLTLGFQNIIHDAEPQFQRMMQSNFNASGIEIQSLRIEQIEFADKSMQKQVSEFAMTNTKLTSQQQTINAQRIIRVAEAERDASTLMISSRAEADKMIMMADANNQVLIRNAKAEAENRLILAEAEAQAKIKIGEAELSIQDKQNQMPNAQLRIFTDAQVEVMRGIQKVVYTDQQSLLMKPFFNVTDAGFTPNS